MAVLTSRDAEVRLDGIGIAKARDISLQLSSETPEDSCSEMSRALAIAMPSRRTSASREVRTAIGAARGG